MSFLNPARILSFTFWNDKPTFSVSSLALSNAFNTFSTAFLSSSEILLRLSKNADILPINVSSSAFVSFCVSCKTLKGVFSLSADSLRSSTTFLPLSTSSWNIPSISKPLTNFSKKKA